MSIDDLEIKLREALAKRNQNQIHDAFCEFERAGGLQAEAYELGLKIDSEIMDIDEELDDMLRDVLDFVCGWCSPHNKIWKD
ncbi:MAG: hypothetical protein KA149_12525 [Chitinophagales bacterium]|nr:hypothetical protein [Chitinophagales bacterium]